MADSDSLAGLLRRWEHIARGWNDRQSLHLETQVLTPLSEHIPLLRQQEEQIARFIARMERRLEDIEEDTR